jgi:hypothetical protein
MGTTTVLSLKMAVFSLPFEMEALYPVLASVINV